MKNISLILISLVLGFTATTIQAETSEIPNNAEMRNLPNEIKGLVRLYYTSYFLDNYKQGQDSILIDNNGNKLVNDYGFDPCEVKEITGISSNKTDFIPTIDYSRPSEAFSITTIYKNQESTPVKVNTASANLTKVNTFSTAITHGWEAGFSVEFSGEVTTGVSKAGKKLSINAKYNGNKNSTTLTSTSKAFTANNQEFNVPGRTEGILVQYMEIGSVSGNYVTYTGLNRNAKIYLSTAGNGGCNSGRINGYIELGSFLDYVDHVAGDKYFPKWIHRDGSNYQITTEGTFTASGTSDSAIIERRDYLKPL